MEKYNLIQMSDSVHCLFLKAWWMTPIKCRKKHLKKKKKKKKSERCLFKIE